MPTPDLSAYSDLFLKTASEHIEEIEKLLDLFQSAPSPAKIADEMFRHVHSLKGSSSVMGYTKIADACEQVDRIIHPENQTFTYSPEVATEISKLVETIKNDLGNALHDTHI